MSASTPANRRSTPGARRFDYCRFIELDYVPMETGYMVSMRPTKGPAPTRSPTKGFASTKSPDRHSRSTNSPSSTPRSRRTPATPSNRDPFGNPSLSSSSNSGSCKGSDCSPTKGRQKYTSCTDNHGIRPPPPEQYLTPLQQKEVCIRHLRAKLKETIHTLQDRDTEIDALRGQLYRMQEDWVEEECHRVEAQLALKEARQEIQQLKGAVETVRARLGDAGGVPAGDAVLAQKYFQDINAQNHKLENLLLHMDLAQVDAPPPAAPPPGRRARVLGGSAPASVSGESPGAAPKMSARGGGRGSSCSCDASPARSLNLTRSSTYTKLSEPPLGTRDSGFVCDGGLDDGDHGNHGGVPSRADLLLEAAFLSEETASLLSCYSQTFSVSGSMPHAYPHTLPRSTPHAAMPPHAIPHPATCERLCLAPVCGSHPCLSHHHLYLHPLREAGIQTESCPLDLDTVAEQRTFRSQACSPTSTWVSDEAEEDLDSISTSVSMATVTEPIPASRTPPAPGLPRSATVAFSTQGGGDGRKDKGEREALSWEEPPGEEGGGSGGEGTDDSPGGESRAEIGFAACCGGGGVRGGATSGNTEGADNRQPPPPTSPSPNLSPNPSPSPSPNPSPNPSPSPNLSLSPSLDQAGIPPGNELEPHTSQPRRSPSHQEVGGVRGGATTGNPEGADNRQPPPPTSPGPNPSLDPVGIPPGNDLEPHTSQPRRSPSHQEVGGVTVVEVDEDDRGGAEGRDAPPRPDGVQKSYWSRHFLVDLLAVAVPVVPTLAWLCRGPARHGQPMYHIGSLLRGCCTVALHSLRRGGGLRHYPAGGGDLGGFQI